MDIRYVTVHHGVIYMETNGVVNAQYKILTEDHLLQLTKCIVFTVINSRTLSESKQNRCWCIP